MDEREKSIYAAGEALLAERLTQNIATIEATIHAAPEVYAETFLEALQTVLQQAVTAQEKGDKGSLRYICISYLQSSLHTGSYQLRLDAYDERQFGDIADACAYWSPQFIFQYMDDDMAYFRTHIGKHVVQVREHEVMRFAMRYSMHYFRIVQQFITELMEPLVASDALGAEALTVMFGGYMDQAVVLVERGQVEQ